MWNNEQLSEGKTLAQYKIPSEAHLTLGTLHALTCL